MKHMPSRRLLTGRALEVQPLDHLFEGIDLFGTTLYTFKNAPPPTSTGQWMLRG